VANPVALVTPVEAIMTAPLLKITPSSRPSSRMTSSAATSCGTTVDTRVGADPDVLDAAVAQASHALRRRGRGQ
jgi:hypothetical protein